MSLTDSRTVVQSTICPYSVWLMEKLNPSDTLDGKRGILDTIQNPIVLSNANTPKQYHEVIVLMQYCVIIFIRLGQCS